MGKSSRHRQPRPKVDPADIQPQQSPPWKFIGIVIVTIIIAMGLARNYFDFPWAASEQEYRASEVILIYEQLFESLISNTIQMESVREEDPLVFLLKSNLRPIQERISSLMKQVGLYERMERIPGGPVSFISTTLQELSYMKMVQIPGLDREALKMIQDFKLNGGLLMAIEAKRKELHSNQKHKFILQLLAEEGVQFYPFRSDPIVTDHRGQTLATLKEKFSRLRVLFQLREDLYDQILDSGLVKVETDEEGPTNPGMIPYILGIWSEEWGPQQGSNQWVQYYTVLKDRIASEIKINKEFYKVSEFLREKAWATMDSMVSAMGDPEDWQKPYGLLNTQIIMDIRALEMRVIALTG